MKITAIKKQQRDAERVSVFVDDVYSFSLSINQLLEQKLRIGLDIEEGRLEELQDVSQSGKIYGNLLKYITLRPRSFKEVEDYCKRKNIDPEEYQPMIEKIQNLGYLDDTKFASSWVENRRLNKPISQKMLRQELSQKGVSEAIISQSLSEYDEEKSLRKIIDKKRRLSKYKDDQKLIQYLLRQGFDYHLIKNTLEV